MSQFICAAGLPSAHSEGALLCFSPQFRLEVESSQVQGSFVHMQGNTDVCNYQLLGQVHCSFIFIEQALPLQ